MPVMAVKRDGTWRIVEAETGKIARNAQGSPIDGGGHENQSKALAQVRAVNANSKKENST